MSQNKNILIVGMNPHTIDFSSPGFLPGMTAEKVEAGIKAERDGLKTLGYDSDMCLLDFGKNDLSELTNILKSKIFEGILIGAGLRVPTSNFILFEQTINTVHEYAAKAKIIFNTSPMDTQEAVRRWV
jgi:hypothetical protein